MSLERKSPLDLSLISASVIFGSLNLASLAESCLYWSNVRTWPCGFFNSSSSNAGSTVVTPPISSKCPCLIVHLFKANIVISILHIDYVNQMNPDVLLFSWFSPHCTGYKKNENKEKEFD